MHPISFQLKRAHLRSVAFGMKVIERIEHMTPATFDVMYAIRTDFGSNPRLKNDAHGWSFGGAVDQKEIWQKLGLHPSTISKLLKRLRNLGWVDNAEWSNSDGRTKTVRLTETGFHRIERAMRIVLHQHTHLKHFEAWFKRFSSPNVLERVDGFWQELRSLGKHLEDPSEFLYDVGYEPERRVPAYMLFDWKRWERRDSKADDQTSYGNDGKFPHTSEEECSVGSPKPRRRVATRGFRGRCLTNFSYASDRPETRTNILMLSRCEPDPQALARGKAKRDADWSKAASNGTFNESDPNRFDPYLEALRYAKENEERLRRAAEERTRASHGSPGEQHETL